MSKTSTSTTQLTGNKEVSSLIFSSMFSVLLFFLLLAILSDTIDDYAGKIITDEVQSVANFLVLIYSFSIMAVIIVANILSKVNILISLIGGIAAYIITMLIMMLISYISLLLTYPNIFVRNGQQVPWWEIILNFSLLNTLFAVYILESTTTYFFIIMAMMIVISYVFVKYMGGYESI